jgi:hypothetical protein
MKGMNKMTGAQVVFTDFDRDDLEQALLQSLSPVDPNPEFVGRLSVRFKRSPVTILENRTFWGAYIIMALGLFAGTFLLWLIQKLGSRN